MNKVDKLVELLEKYKDDQKSCIRQGYYSDAKELRHIAHALLCQIEELDPERAKELTYE